MTTWELASDGDRQVIRGLMESITRAGGAVPAAPASVQSENLVGLTKRDAGKYITHLRETLRDVGAGEA